VGGFRHRHRSVPKCGWSYKAAYIAILLQGEGGRSNGYVFPNLEGGPIRPRNLTKEFTSTVERAGAPKLPFHSLRRTHASQLLKDGVLVKVVNERLGHWSIGITLEIYAHTILNKQGRRRGANRCGFCRRTGRLKDLRCQSGANSPVCSG
jgi:integrase